MNDNTFKGGRAAYLLELALLPKKGSEMDYPVEGFGEERKKVTRTRTLTLTLNPNLNLNLMYVGGYHFTRYF